MNRRKFLTYSVAGSTFMLSLDALRPKPADGFILILLFRLVSGVSLLNLALGGLALAALGAGGPRGYSEEWFEERLEVQLAQRRLIDRSFRNVAVVDSNNYNSSYILGAQRDERLGGNVALSFPEVRNSVPKIATFAGPASMGMYAAAKYLREHERMTQQEVAAAVLPRYQEYNDFGTWDTPTSFTTYTNRASERGVTIRYDALNREPGGKGIIDVTVNARQRIKIPNIEVQYS